MKKTVVKQRLLIQIMKITVFQFILAFVFSTVTMANGLKAQGKLSTKVTINVTNIGLENALSKLEETARVKFSYNSRMTQLNEKVSIVANNESLSTVLTRILKPLNIGFAEVSNQIVLQKETTKKVGFTGAETQNDVAGNVVGDITVNGKIISSSDGMPITGASVTIEGSNKSTKTDFEGKFQIVADSEAVLKISYVGYTTQLIPVKSQTSINVVLETETADLKEVVVVGYGSTNKKNLASSVSVVNAKDLKNLTTTDMALALQGKMAGVQVTSANGDPGSSGKIVIRGAGSFSSTEPLFVIDGIVGGDFKSVSVQDIQSVTVLKDAATAAIYGSAAANGVVIITTKNGETGKMKISYDGSYGISVIGKRMSMLNASQYVDLVTDIQGTSGITPYLSSPDARIDRTDWQKAAFKTALVSEHNLRLSGGTEFVNYAFSTGVVNQESTIIDSKFQRIIFSTKLSEKLFKNRVKLGQSIRMKYDVTKGSTGSFYDVLYMPPYLSIYDSSVLGGYSRADKVRDLNDANNPFATVYLSPKTDRSLHTEIDLNAEVSILDGFKFKSQARMTADNFHGQTFNYPVDAGSYSRPTSNMNENYSYGYHLYLDNFFSYDKTFGLHNISLMAGNHYNPSGYYGSVSLAGSDFSSDAIQNIGLADPDNKSITGVSVNGGKSRLSYFGKAGYTFDDKYVLNASFRRDGSSVFGENNRWGNFYGIGGAWNVSREDFMSSVSVISNLKLRVSYGKTGNDLIPMFLTNSTVWKGQSNNLVYSLGDADGTYVNGATINSIANPDLKWEESAQTDIGFDLDIFKNTTLVFDYFNRDNKDLLIQTTLPTSTGIGNPGQTPSTVVNGASMKSKGFELGITYNGKVNNFTWNVNMNTTYNTNEVYALGSVGDIPITNGQTRTEIGHPLASFYGYKVDHIAIDQADIDRLNEIAVANGHTEYQSGLLPGDRIWKDTNGDGQADDKDRTFIGNPSPKWQYGLTFNGEYKGFDFQLMLQGLAGVDIANMNHGTFEGMVRPFNSFSTVLDRWRQPGDITTLPAAGQNPDSNLSFSDWYVEKGDYMRVKNISVGYTIPSSLFKAGKLRIYFALQNILTFTSYTGYDPEVSASDNSDKGYIFTRGVDEKQHPNPKIYRIGLQLNF